MRNVRWLRETLSRVESRSGLGAVLALLVAGFVLQEQCLAQSASDPVAIAASPGAAWTSTGNLNVPRAGHTATLLQNGKVLVTGGSDDGSAEVYDPATGAWTLTGSLRKARRGHTATLLPNGKVLAVGGDTSPSGPDFGRTGTAELYDPATGSWNLTGSMSTTRFGHTATLLQNGKVLVAGGASDNLASAELYDPFTGTWNSTGRLGIARYWHTATLLQDGRVLIARGTNDGDLSTTLSQAELYDPITGAWSNAGDLGPPSVFHSATLLPNGRVLVAGGYQPSWSNPDGTGFKITNSLSNAEIYDPASRMVSHTGSMSAIRSRHTATLLPDGGVLVVGGDAWQGQYPGIQVSTQRSAELYDSVSGQWAGVESPGTARSGHTATLLPDGRVLVAGGASAPDITLNITLATAQLYGTAVVVPRAGADGTAIAVPTAIGAGTTGSWYDPAQSGHGFALEVLEGPPRQLLAYWFTFAPQGDQSWIAALGPIDGNRAELQGIQTVGAGARFPPNFDAANARQESWGTLTFTFSDCNHGHVDWDSIAPGYGSGGMDLTRLTLPAGLTCQ